MNRRLWQALVLFTVPFKKIPMIEARQLLPSVLLLMAYSGMMVLWPAQPELAFTTAFVLCQTARFSLREGAGRAQSGVGRKPLLAAVLIPGAVLIAAQFPAQFPALCQHLPSLISAGYVLLLGLDALDGSHATTRDYWPGKAYAPYARELTQAMVLLHLVYILLNETVIVAASLQGWLVFLALLPIVQHVLMTALFRTVFWLVPEPGQRER